MLEYWYKLNGDNTNYGVKKNDLYFCLNMDVVDSHNFIHPTASTFSVNEKGEPYVRVPNLDIPKTISFWLYIDSWPEEDAFPIIGIDTYCNALRRFDLIWYRKNGRLKKFIRYDRECGQYVFLGHPGTISFNSFETLTIYESNYSSAIRLVTDESNINNTNALKGTFSINNKDKICFAKGNLRYTKSTDTYFFATNLYDSLQTLNKINGLEADTMDLFVSNKLSDIPITDPWKHLSSTEFNYILSYRNNAENLFAVASIELLENTYINGLILLPDTWVCPDNIIFKPGYDKNTGRNCKKLDLVFNLSLWQKLEQSGAVFLPYTGYIDSGVSVVFEDAPVNPDAISNICDLHLGWNHIAISYCAQASGIKETITINGTRVINTGANVYNLYCRGISSKITTPNCLISDYKSKSIYESVEMHKLESELQLIHYPFNNIVLPCEGIGAKTGIQHFDYTSTITKDSSVLTGSLPNVPKEWIMNHLGETICVSAYVYSLGSYNTGTNHTDAFGVDLRINYKDNNDLTKMMPINLHSLGLNGLYYTTFIIPSDIKSCITDLEIHNYTLGTSTVRPGSCPTEYGVTWTFSHFKIELGDYPTSPLGNPLLVEDTSGNNYHGTIIGSPKVCLDSPRYDYGIRLEGKAPQFSTENTIVLLNLYDNYGPLPLDTFTISFWVNFNKKVNTYWAQLLGVYNNGNGLILSANPGFTNGFAINKYISGTNYVTYSSKMCELNTWYHYVLVYDNSSENKYNLYLNGESQSLLGDLTNHITELPNTPMIINRSSFGDFNISDFRIYRTAFSELQIKDLYNESAVIDYAGNIFTYELNEL